MRTPRFFVDDELIAGREVALPSRTLHHATTVLRIRDRAPLVLFNGRGGEYSAVFDRKGGTALVEAYVAVDRESPLAVTLVQAWVVNVKLDLIVEKAVELGVARVVLVPTLRSVAKLSGDRLKTRIEHLRGIAVSACAQSGRTRIPAINAAGGLEDGLKLAAQDATAVALVPGATASAAAVIDGAQRVALAVGPEGGFDEAELALAARIGYRPAHLGPRILRTETAGLAALAHLQARAGDAR